MMKINLSDSDDSRKKKDEGQVQKTAAEESRETVTEEAAETVVLPSLEEEAVQDGLDVPEPGETTVIEPEPEETAVPEREETPFVPDDDADDIGAETPVILKEASDAGDKESRGGNKALLLLIILLVILIGAAAYLKRDSIFALFRSRQPVVQVAPPAPPQPEPQPEPEPVIAEPDPTFLALNRIGEAVPDRLWLTSAVIMYDGSYDIAGIAFTHDSMNVLVGGLGSNGNVAESAIPGKAKSAETVYRFTVGGKVDDISVPEILDNIPVAELVDAAAGVKDRGADFDLAFVRLPESGRTYDDEAMPFAVAGSYAGLKKLIGELCPEDGDRRIYRIVIAPSRPGRSFDRVEASFSLKTVSSL